MTDPTKDPAWYQTWGNVISTVAISMLTMIVTSVTFFYSQLRRLDKIEALALKVDERLDGFDADLKQHVDEDYYEFGEVHKKVEMLVPPVERVDEAVGWIKGSLQDNKKNLEEVKKSIEAIKNDRSYIHERVKQHDLNNEAANAAYQKEILGIIEIKDKKILELESQVALLTRS